MSPIAETAIVYRTDEDWGEGTVLSVVGNEARVLWQDGPVTSWVALDHLAEVNG